MLIKKDLNVIRAYLEDSSNLKGGHADEVIFPESIDELSEFLREANSKKLPVTIAGGGTGTTGARIPFGGVLISMERLNRIVDISKETSSCVVQPGVTVDELKNASEKMGLFYPCHPTEGTAFVGGTVATNASGSRSFRYGPTRKYVKGLKMILANGEVLFLPRGKIFLKGNNFKLRLPSGLEITIPLPTYKMPDVKNSAGYFAKSGMDLIDLFIGQEGTLSAIVEIGLELVKRPSKILASFVFFKTEEDAWNFSSEIKHDGTFNILSLEYLDSNAIELLRLKNKDVPKGARSAIFFEEEVSSVDDNLERYEALIKRNRASIDDTWFGMTEKNVKEFSEFRHWIPESVNDLVRRNGFQKMSTDIAVPEKRFLEMMNFYVGAFKRDRISHVIFGHIGENHVHVNCLPKSEGELNLSKEICLGFVKKGVSLGGTVSAEHGIGKTRHRYLEEMYGREGILEMARIKKALDPNWMLGLDNIFPRDTLNLI